MQHMLSLDLKIPAWLFSSQRASASICLALVKQTSSHANNKIHHDFSLAINSRDLSYEPEWKKGQNTVLTMTSLSHVLEQALYLLAWSPVRRMNKDSCS